MKEKNTVIQDPVMEPYFISKGDAGGFLLNKRREGDPTKFITVCYPVSILKCLQVIVQEKLHDGHTYESLAEYFETWEKLNRELVECIGKYEKI